MTNKAINWQDDESVVRAAVPDVDVSYSDLRQKYRLFINGATYSGTSLKRLWELERNRDVVQAFEREHNPAMNDKQKDAGAETDTGFDSAWIRIKNDRLNHLSVRDAILVGTLARELWSAAINWYNSTDEHPKITLSEAVALARGNSTPPTQRIAFAAAPESAKAAVRDVGEAKFPELGGLSGLALASLAESAAVPVPPPAAEGDAKVTYRVEVRWLDESEFVSAGSCRTESEAMFRLSCFLNICKVVDALIIRITTTENVIETKGAKS